MYNYPEEEILIFHTSLSLYKDLDKKIDFVDDELRKLEYLMYCITINKIQYMSIEEKKSKIYEMNIIYDEMNLTFNVLTHEKFVLFKEEIISNLERFPTDISITYLNGLLKQLKDDELQYDNSEDKSVEIFLNNELRKQKIKKILND
jgi:hypothetical protein